MQFGSSQSIKISVGSLEEIATKNTMPLIADTELGALLGTNFSDSETLVPGQVQQFPLGVLSLEGADTIVGSSDSELINGNQDDDLILGGLGTDTLFGGQDNDSLDGQGKEDQLFGNLGQDTLNGGEGSDSLFGGQDNDQLFGNQGQDTLSGDKGSDTLTGGEGADVFVAQLSGAEPDLITDFQDGIDLIQLPENLEFTDLQLREQGTEQILITDAATGEELVILEGFSLSELTAVDFIRSFDDIVEKLDSVPVFTITDSDGSPLLGNGENASVVEVYISRQDADNFLNELAIQNPELASSVQVTAVSLGDIYEIGQQNQNNPERLTFSFVPEQQQLNSAKAILEANGQNITQFRGVPLFLARAGTDDRVITVQQGDQQAIPFFFNKEDLQGMLDQFKTQQPDLISSVKIEVLPLEVLLEAFRTDDDQFLDLIILIPPRETVEFIQEMRLVNTSE
ncbi:hypothetical protein L8106_22526 [Lyngbya sp. PCC 8106]|nr:hypothetical protein L8106_22526 [Lyngbya sp. PCC 8106]